MKQKTLPYKVYAAPVLPLSALRHHYISSSHYRTTKISATADCRCLPMCARLSGKVGVGVDAQTDQGKAGAAGVEVFIGLVRG